ncbi:MAG: putative toxin-antitoxin system toxin component, PIN family [Bacteroidaceae bacterium]|nr:putative toxin-antitoxin system toxin component, PIN family [Bacteroidaceae bacterium]
MRRIVLDTNCLVMVLPSKSSYHHVWIDFLRGTIEFCVSTEILLEYEEKLAEKVSPYMADIVINALINRPNLIKVEPKWRWNLIEADVDDNKFVDCAIAGQAEYIVSNDNHFKILNQIDFPLVLYRRLEDFVKDL